MKIIKHILESGLFINKPPVLADIGASGEINAKWKAIAAWSVCIAYDADDREFSVSEKNNNGYKKLLVVNRVVSAAEQEKTEFYLTSSPFCSSTLKPYKERLSPWLFNQLFEVEKKMQLPATTLQNSFQQAGINYLDWFKTDTQGTDLRIFNSLPQEIKNNVLAAEFEPGIIDAYEGEDKLFPVMTMMDKKEYWLSSMSVKGTQRVNNSGLGLSNFAVKRSLRKSPCWAELCYLHTGVNINDKRQLLLLYIFSLLEKQYGFAIEIAENGSALFNDGLFAECKRAAINKLKQERFKIPFVMLKKQLNKIFSYLND